MQPRLLQEIAAVRRLHAQVLDGPFRDLLRECVRRLSELTSVGEPVYAITVELAGQTINANGQPRPLQAGMRVDADIFQETRKLYEWLLEPLFSVTGRVQP